jgi:hypothetical protein
MTSTWPILSTAGPMNTVRSLNLNPKPKRGRPRIKKDTTMTPTTETTETKRVPVKTAQVTVFDLQAFDDVKLVRNFYAEDLPAKPTTVHEALALVGNDTSKLLELIHQGLIEQTVEAAKSDLSTFSSIPVDDEGKELDPVPYTGTPVSEEKGKSINAMILNFAKTAFGYRKDAGKEKKREAKEKATQLIRDTPAILQSLIDG